MNIKQASKQSGVSAPNIRFYEKEGLLDPARLPGNDYRDYTEQDIRALRFIRMLRMLDVPLPVIRSVLAGDAPLGNILREQQTALEQRAKQLEGAARFCAELARQDPSAASLDVDACLSRMEDPAQPQTFFSGWVQDYRTLAQVQHQKHFFFIPQGSINTPQEFTAALQAYAEERGMQLSLIKEGMYPEFSLDGISYKAYRNPGKYRDWTAVPPGTAAAGPAGPSACGMHLCRHPDGRLDSDRRDRLALAGGTGSSGGPAGPML